MNNLRVTCDWRLRARKKTLLAPYLNMVSEKKKTNTQGKTVN